jgi:hypothetical protein
MKYDNSRVYAECIGNIGNSYNISIAKPEG